MSIRSLHSPAVGTTVWAATRFDTNAADVLADERQTGELGQLAVAGVEIEGSAIFLDGPCGTDGNAGSAVAARALVRRAWFERHVG
jgi:hypothetical protein